MNIEDNKCVKTSECQEEEEDGDDETDNSWSGMKP
jgi:hypothetical protein